VKRSHFYIVWALLAGVLVSCGSLKSDVREYLKLYEEYTRLAEEACRDQLITAEEAENLNKIKHETTELQKEIEEKTRDNEALTNEWKDLYREMNGELITEKYIDACFRLYDCEGAGQIE